MQALGFGKAATADRVELQVPLEVPELIRAPARAPRYHHRMLVAPLLALSLVLVSSQAAAQPAAEPDDGQARISLDVKDSDIVGIVSLLSEVGGFQVVFDPGINCRLTLRLKEVRWATALDLALRACGLGRDGDGTVLRIARVAVLGAESADRQRLEEARALAGERRISAFRLSYARAAEMAPLVKRFLSPRGDVVYDSRTNTLIVVD